MSHEYSLINDSVVRLFQLEPECPYNYHFVNNHIESSLDVIPKLIHEDQFVILTSGALSRHKISFNTNIDSSHFVILRENPQEINKIIPNNCQLIVADYLEMRMAFNSLKGILKRNWKQIDLIVSLPPQMISEIFLKHESIPF